MHSGKVDEIFSLEGNLLRAQSPAWRRQIYVVKMEENLDVEIPKRSEISVVNSPTFKRIKTANNWSMRGRVVLLGLCLPISDIPSPFQYIIPLAFGSRKLHQLSGLCPSKHHLPVINLHLHQICPVMAADLLVHYSCAS